MFIISHVARKYLSKPKLDTYSNTTKDTEERSASENNSDGNCSVVNTISCLTIVNVSVTILCVDLGYREKLRINICRCCSVMP